MDTRIKTIIENWNKHWPNDMLFDNRLKGVLPDLWVRFHTLPESKRYPDTEEELALVVGRHNTLLNDLNPGDDIVLITTQYSNQEADPNLEKNPTDPEATLCHTLFDSPEETDPDFHTYIYFYASEKKWHDGVVDNVLKKVADDSINGVIIAPHDMQWLYHPYDGGVDVYCTSTEQRNQLKEKYKDWLSESKTGL